MGFFIRMYILNYWSYIKSAMSILIGNLTQFNFVGRIFLLTSIVFEIFRKNWKKPPCPFRSPPTGGDFQDVVQDVPLYSSANFQNYTIFFSIFATLTGLMNFRANVLAGKVICRENVLVTKRTTLLCVSNWTFMYNF